MSKMYIALVAAMALTPLSMVRAANDPTVEFTPEVRHDVSLPLRYLATLAAPEPRRGPRALAVRPLPSTDLAAPEQVDGALQSSTGKRIATTDGLNFAGVGQGDYGFTDSSAPPDTNGAAGLTQYVQQVNTALGIFDKTTGALLLSVKATNTIWTGFGGGCETNNDGDGGVKYDRIANRWVITQFSVSTTPYLECVAVSQTSDATGAYYRYAFNYGTRDFIDYPKISVWPDAYYATYNDFRGSNFFGAKVCAFKRSAMLTGAAAWQQCFQLSSAYGGLLASDLDGATLPPAGSPNYLLNFGTNSLNLWKLSLSWAAPKSSKLTGPTAIPVAAFNAACGGGGVCIPQKGTSQKLDSLADRLMYRLAYRNFGDHESLVVNHSVTAGGVTGVRWYELRSPGIIPAIYQSGTFAPDKISRWMGSVAMDKVGDIAVGYSASSGGIYPSIRYTGRVPTDALGTLETEMVVKVGGGSQNGNLDRWGDYTSMSVDPVDDCTFFYSNEYEKSTGSFNWSTQINAFKFPGCQ